MNPEQEDWRKDAFEVYRLAWSDFLIKHKAPQSDEVVYFIEELKEALLDLKEATIADDPLRAIQHIQEVTVLVVELRLRLEGA